MLVYLLEPVSILVGTSVHFRLEPVSIPIGTCANFRLEPVSFSVGTGVVFSRIQCRKFLECMSFFLGFSVGKSFLISRDAVNENG